MSRKLPMLKPRVATIDTQRGTVVAAGSWRAGKVTAAARGYDYRWQKARAVFLRANPLCASCTREGRVVPATIVDHIVPHRGDHALFWDETNWQGLCRPCDDEKRTRENRGEV